MKNEQHENTNKVIVDSFNVEFGYELISVLPYAYWHYINGTLESTKSGAGSESLYYFSPKHETYNENRSWDNMTQFRKSGLPNVYIHQSKLNTEKFLIPPFKDIYKNNIYKYEKPIICICNRYNKEWGEDPINYFSLDCLDNMFNLLKKDYQIIYWATNIPEQLHDGVKPLELGDYNHVKKYHKEVLIFQDLVVDNDWNKTQLMIFANCEKFITMNGGYSILASYFGGTNIIYSKKCQEIKVNSFNLWYHEFNKSRIVHVDNYEGLMDSIDDIYKKKNPTINILVRTSNRPLAFDICINSILNQTYKNINIIVSYDDEQTFKYIKKYPIHAIKCNKVDSDSIPTINNIEYGAKAPYNLYLNTMMEYVTDGWITYQDDDDCYCDLSAIQSMVNNIVDDDSFILWRTYSSQKIVPSDRNFGIFPVNCDIGGNSYLFHAKHKDYAIWEEYRKGNYRVAKKLYSVLNPIWINKLYCRTQENKTGNGLCIDNLEGIVDIPKIDSFNTQTSSEVIKITQRSTNICNLSVGIVYSGRLPLLLDQIISSIKTNTSFLKRPVELIIINNSNDTLNITNDFFQKINIISGIDNNFARSTLSELLANNYNKIIEQSTGNIIYLIEDDMLPEKDCFRNMLYHLLQYDKAAPCLVGSVYYSRHIPERIVGGFFKDKPEWIYTYSISNKPITVDFTGTGCCLFWKNNAPKFKDSTSFGIKSHDWAFCEDIKNAGGDVYILPNALCRHYQTETDYLLYEPQKRKEPLKRIKNGSKQSFFDIMLPRHKVHR